MAIILDADVVIRGEYHERIVNPAQASQTVRKIAGALGAGFFEKTQLMPLEFFQKNCGILVKNSLRHEGIETE